MGYLSQSLFTLFLREGLLLSLEITNLSRLRHPMRVWEPWRITAVLYIRRLRQEDCKFKSEGIVYSRPVWAVWQPGREEERRVRD